MFSFVASGICSVSSRNYTKGVVDTNQYCNGGPETLQRICKKCLTDLFAWEADFVVRLVKGCRCEVVSYVTKSALFQENIFDAERSWGCRKSHFEVILSSNCAKISAHMSPVQAERQASKSVQKCCKKCQISFVSALRARVTNSSATKNCFEALPRK